MGEFTGSSFPALYFVYTISFLFLKQFIMSMLNLTPLRDLSMEGQRRQINFKVHHDSEPFLKKKRVLVNSKYQANTCDVGVVDVVGGGGDDIDDPSNPYLDLQ